MKQQPLCLFADILKPEIWLLFIAFIVPSLLLYADFLPRRLFFLTLGGFPTVVMFFYMTFLSNYSLRCSLRKLGLSLELTSIWKLLPPTFFLLLLGSFCLAAIPWIMGRPRALYLDLDYYGWYLGMCLFQELMWRAFAFLLLEKVVGHREKALVICSASLFAFSHIYFRSLLILCGTWFLGWLWGKNYWTYRSIAGPVVSHCLVGLPFIVLNYMSGNQHWGLL
ncbi:MAG: CPBP family glutamic-type intramembrane protease [Cyanobacteria bacterium P01_A01_bin.116]